MSNIIWLWIPKIYDCPWRKLDNSAFPCQMCIYLICEADAPTLPPLHVLPGATPSAEGKRKRNKSVSNMEKASIEPPEEEEEERPVVNGNGVVVTPG